MSEEVQSMVQVLELTGRGLSGLMKGIRLSAKGVLKGAALIDLKRMQLKMKLHYASTGTHGTMLVKDLEKLTGGQYDILNIPFEDEKSLIGFYDRLKKLNVSFAELPDLNLGDGYTQIAYNPQDADRVKAVVEYYKDKLEVEAAEISLDQYEKMGDEKAQQVLNELAEKGYQQEKQMNLLRTIRDRNKDDSYVPISIDIQTLLIREDKDSYLCYVPGTQHEQTMTVKKEDCLLFDDRKVIYTHLRKDDPAAKNIKGNYNKVVAKYKKMSERTRLDDTEILPDFTKGKESPKEPSPEKEPEPDWKKKQEKERSMETYEEQLQKQNENQKYRQERDKEYEASEPERAEEKEPDVMDTDKTTSKKFEDKDTKGGHDFRQNTSYKKSYTEKENAASRQENKDTKSGHDFQQNTSYKKSYVEKENAASRRESKENGEKGLKLIHQKIDDDQYLHFTAELDGTEIAGTFRICNPKDGADFELVSLQSKIFDGNGKNKSFSGEQWDFIEQELKESTRSHYEVIQKNREHEKAMQKEKSKSSVPSSKGEPKRLEMKSDAEKTIETVMSREAIKEKAGSNNYFPVSINLEKQLVAESPGLYIVKLPEAELVEQGGETARLFSISKEDAIISKDGKHAQIFLDKEGKMEVSLHDIKSGKRKSDILMNNEEIAKKFAGKKPVTSENEVMRKSLERVKENIPHNPIQGGKKI